MATGRPLGAASFCVIDIETAISEPAASLAAGGKRPDINRVALHELVAASVLRFRRSSKGLADVSQTSVGGVGEDEPSMLRTIDEILRAAHESGAVLVTFNGAHDMGVLRRRAARYWMFERLSYSRWPILPGGDHVDLMRRDPIAAGGRWPSLVDAAAGFGIDAVLRPLGPTSETLSPAVRKSEVDVVATALLLFHHIAVEAGGVGPVVEGWADLSAWIVRCRPLEDHLRQFARHPFALAARDMKRGTV